MVTANLDTVIKTLKRAEEELAAGEKHALSQTDSIAKLQTAVAQYMELARTNRLLANRLFTTEKANRKLALVTKGGTDFAAFMAELNATFPKPYMPAVQTDFAGVTSGLKSIDSMKNAIDSELARAKIEANAISTLIQLNLKTLVELASEHKFLFSDTAQIVLKANDDLTALVKTRISEHKAEVKRKEEETRERIRAEEQAKAEKDARDKVKAEQAEEDALIDSLWAESRRIERDTTPYILKAKATFETAARDWENDPRPRVVTAVTDARAEMAAKLEAAQAREQEEALRREKQNAAGTDALQGIDEARREESMPAPVLNALEGVATAMIADLAVSRASETSKPAANVVPMRAAAAPAPAAPPATPPSLKLGEINLRLTPIQLSAEGLRILGFEPAGKAGAAVLFHERDFPHMCAAVIRHVESVQAKQAA